MRQEIVTRGETSRVPEMKRLAVERNLPDITVSRSGSMVDLGCGEGEQVRLQMVIVGDHKPKGRSDISFAVSPSITPFLSRRSLGVRSVTISFGARASRRRSFPLLLVAARVHFRKPRCLHCSSLLLPSCGAPVQLISNHPGSAMTPEQKRIAIMRLQAMRNRAAENVFGAR